MAVGGVELGAVGGVELGADTRFDAVGCVKLRARFGKLALLEQLPAFAEERLGFETPRTSGTTDGE